MKCEYVIMFLASLGSLKPKINFIKQQNAKIVLIDPENNLEKEIFHQFGTCSVKYVVLRDLEVGFKEN